MAGYKRNKRGQFLKGFSGMSAVRKKKFLSANKSATKARMDKQNLITRGSFDGSEAFPVKTNVKSISNGGKTARLAKATSPRTVQVGNSAPVEVKKGQLLADLNVGLSKNQKARVDDYMARPKRLKAGAAKKKQAFANDGKARTGQPVHKPKSLEGRDPRAMSDAEKIQAYTEMHGKPPSDAQLKKLGNRAPATHAADRNAKTKALEDMGKRTSKEKIDSDSARLAAWEAASRPKTNATPSVSPTRDNSTPLNPPAERARLYKELDAAEKVIKAHRDKNPSRRDADGNWIHPEWDPEMEAAVDKRQRLTHELKNLSSAPAPSTIREPRRGGSESARTFAERTGAPAPKTTKGELDNARKMAVRLGLLSPSTAKKDRITSAKVARRESGRPTKRARLDATIATFQGRPGEERWQTNRRLSARAENFAKRAKAGKADMWGDREVTLNGKKVGSIRKRTEGEPIMNGRIKVGSTAAKGFYLKHGRQTRHTSDNRVGNALEQLQKLRDSTAALNAREAKSAIRRKKLAVKRARVSASGGRAS